MHYDAAALRWLFSFVKPYRVRLTAILALSLISTGLALAQPYLTKILIDDGLLARNFERVLWFCGLLLAAALASSLVGALNRWHYIDVSARILHALREQVYAHMLTLSPNYYARTRGGDLVARLDGDVAEIQRFAVDTLLAAVNGLLALFGALLLMLSLSWHLSLLAFVVLPVNIVFLRRMRPKVEHYSRSVRERASAISAYFFEALPAIPFIQSVTAEQREAQQLAQLNTAFRIETLRAQMLQYLTTTIPSLLMALSTAMVFVIGGYWVVQEQLTLGTLIAFAAYLARAMGPVQTLLGLYVAAQRAHVSLLRVREITQVEAAVTSPPQPKPFPAQARGEICFQGVTFAYGNTDVLKQVDMTLPAGKKIGLSGVSGVGKSTLIRLLQRYYDPDTGRILIDDIDIREFDLRELRRRIAVVAQDIALFSGSVVDNIRYAVPTASLDDVLNAAKLAQVDRFATKLAQGYQTNIGSQGAALSGGQRQRIAIARALLQDPHILILDEATSAVDQATEQQIIAAIDALFAQRTRLIISHRAQALVGADMILRLQDE